MRYRFVGGQDVPEWILAEVGVLSKISCVRLKLISRQIVLDLCGSSPLDFEKLARLVPKDSGFTGSDVKATVAAITFILTNATRYAVNHDVLNAELQQLGLPKENSDGISRPYRIHREKLLAQAAADALRLPRLCSVTTRADYYASSSACGSLIASGSGSGSGPAKVVHVSLGVADRSGAGYSAGRRITAVASAGEDATVSSAVSTALLATYEAAKSKTKGSSNIEAQAALAMRAIDAAPLLGPAAAAPAHGAEVTADRSFAFSMSHAQASTLLAELKTARKVLGALTESHQARLKQQQQQAASFDASGATAVAAGGAGSGRGRAAFA